MTTTDEARASPAQPGGRHHRRIRPGRPRGHSDAERAHRSREHNWSTSRVLAAAVRAHLIGSVTLRTGQRALIEYVSAGQTR
jgi:hypothetical protein